MLISSQQPPDMSYFCPCFVEKESEAQPDYITCLYHPGRKYRVCLTPKSMLVTTVMMYNYPRTLHSASGVQGHQTTPCVIQISVPGSTFPVPWISECLRGEGSRFPEFGRCISMCGMACVLQPAQNNTEETPIVSWPLINHSAIQFNWCL